MKVWKLVSGILSIVFAVLVFFQSALVGLGNAIQENGEVGGSAGLLVAIVLLVGGIVSIVTRNGGKGGAIALIILFGIGAMMGAAAGSYKDLTVWAGWCGICAVFALISLFIKKKPE